MSAKLGVSVFKFFVFLPSCQSCCISWRNMYYRDPRRINMPIWDWHVVYFIEDFDLVIDLSNTKLATRIVVSPTQDVTYSIISLRIVGLVWRRVGWLHCKESNLLPSTCHLSINLPSLRMRPLHPPSWKSEKIRICSSQPWLVFIFLTFLMYISVCRRYLRIHF